jgi:hypothetical protein
MSATSRWSGVAPRRRDAVDAVEELVADRSSADLVAVAQELLLLVPAFEVAFPRERTREASPGVVGAVRRILRRDAFSPLLPRPVRADFESLLTATPLGSALPSKARILELADASLRIAAEIAPRAAAPHLVRAQREWVFDGSRENVHGALENARARVVSPIGAAAVLLHLAILRADDGFVDEAIEMLEIAMRLDAGSLAANWTCAVYSTAIRPRRPIDRQLWTIARIRDSAALRRRALALHGQFDALARIGVLSSACARVRADRFLSLLPPLSAAATRP